MSDIATEAPVATSSRVRRNAAAGFAGRMWTALVGLVCVPLLVRLLGIERYGLVGLYTTLQAMVVVLDLGLGTTLNRELARLSSRPDTAQRQRDLARTLQLLYWTGAVCLAVIATLLAPVVARHWISASSVAPGVIENAVRLMGVGLAVQLPFILYEGALMGLQRHVALNVIVVVNATLRFAGGVAVLWWLSRRIEVFFAWQLVVSAVTTTSAAWLLWRSLPRTPKSASFDPSLVREAWQFASGMAGVSLTGALLGQMDKLVLSKLVTLRTFGYYSLASVLASSLSIIVMAIFGAVFPRLSQLVALGDEQRLRALYHRASQALAAFVLPAAVIMALFSRELLELWTRNPELARSAAPLLTLLAIGSALNGLMHAPYALQLAYGWTSLPLFSNLLALVALVPILVTLTVRYGALGAAVTWIVLNVGYVTIGVWFTHRRILRGQYRSWWLNDLAKPLLATLVVVGTSRALLSASVAGTVTQLALLGLTLFVATAAALSLTSSGRQLVSSIVGR